MELSIINEPRIVASRRHRMNHHSIDGFYSLHRSNDEWVSFYIHWPRDSLLCWPYNSSQKPHGENLQYLQLNQHLHDDPDGHSSSLIQPVGAVASRRYAASGVASGVASGANTGTSTPSRRNGIDIESSRFLFMRPPLLKFVLMRPSALSWIDVDCTSIFSLRTRSVMLAGCADDTAKTETRQTNDLIILLSWRVWYAVSRRELSRAHQMRMNDNGGLGALL